MKKLALLGAARPRYEERIRDVLNRPDCDYCWVGWSFRIDKKKLEKLVKEHKRDGFFNIYYHDIKTPKEEHRDEYNNGIGFVSHRIEVYENMYKETQGEYPNKDCASSDKNEKHRLYIKINELPKKIPEKKKWFEFIDYDTEEPLNGRYPWISRNSEFKYIIDESQLEKP